MPVSFWLAVILDFFPDAASLVAQILGQLGQYFVATRCVLAFGQRIAEVGRVEGAIAAVAVIFVLFVILARPVVGTQFCFSRTAFLP